MPVALVSMPFVLHGRPSLQLGLLKSIAAAHGFPVTTFHLHLDFAQQIGLPLYETLCLSRSRECLLGDWLFSVAAFGDDAPDPDDRLLDDFGAEVDRLLASLDMTRDQLRAIRHEEVPKYLDAMLNSIAWEQFRVVGFTATFQQNAASFALAGRIKRKFPDVTLLFGGANFEGEMGLELVRSVDCVDYAVIGEGDQTFPEFLIALLEGRDPAEAPGVVCRRDGAVTPLQTRPPFERMDDLPVPDYEEFFERAESLGLLAGAPRRDVDIPFESARGCWWGQKHHCTFCGLNGGSIAFRAKSPQRVRDELAELASRYRCFQFQAVDNIMDTAYLRDFFALLVESGDDYEFFYEVKSNLTREQIKTLHKGGVRRIQPGIESLNSHVLKLMRKGVTAIQNVNTLRWSLYYDIEAAWNLLYGFPGETEEDYRQQSALLRRVVHLQPPSGAGRIWMERFSPIFFDRKSFPARFVRPEARYAYVYPKRVNIANVAYFFEYELENTLPDAAYEETCRQVKAWQKAWEGETPPTLTFWRAPGFLQIEDVRDPASPTTYTLTDDFVSLYAACSDRPQSVRTARDALRLEASADEIEEIFDDLCARGLMMRDGDLFLSLALPATPGR